MANYLVTGAAGFIGSKLAKYLVDEGHNIVTIDNLSTGVVENIPTTVNFVEGDCSDPEIYTKIPQEPYDAIFHIAGQSSGEISYDDPVYDIRTNTESTILLLKFALKNGCNRFIYAGTMSVYGIQPDCPVVEDDVCTPMSFYGVGKLASEHYMRLYQQYGINSTSLRLFNVYGPGQNMTNLRQGMVSIFLKQALDDHKIHVKGSSERYRDFIFIDDVVMAFVQCLKKQASFGQVINVGTGVRTTVKQVVDTIIEMIGNDIPVEYYGATYGDIHGIYAMSDLMYSILEMPKVVEFRTGMQRMVEWALINRDKEYS